MTASGSTTTGRKASVEHISAVGRAAVRRPSVTGFKCIQTDILAFSFGDNKTPTRHHCGHVRIRSIEWCTQWYRRREYLNFLDTWSFNDNNSGTCTGSEHLWIVAMSRSRGGKSASQNILRIPTQAGRCLLRFFDKARPFAAAAEQQQPSIHRIGGGTKVKFSQVGIL